MTTTPSISGTELTDPQTQALLLKLTVLADDEIILAHRNGEWTGHAPSSKRTSRWRTSRRTNSGTPDCT